MAQTHPDEQIASSDWTDKAQADNSKPPSIRLDTGYGDQQQLSDNGQPSREGTPPPLPPRPRNNLHLLEEQAKTPAGSLRLPKNATRPTLQSKATTALSLTDIHSQSRADASGGSQSPASRQVSFRNFGHGSRSRSGSDDDDGASVKSSAPTLEASADMESLLGEVLASHSNSAWETMKPHLEITQDHAKALFPSDPKFDEAFEHEFDEVDEVEIDGSNEEAVMKQWRSKLKHFLILTSAGKPVWSRHGDDQVVTNYIGIVQTIISFYQGARDGLKGFTAGDVRFVIMSKGSLNLVAISRLGESDGQLRAQLEALYMQILSTLTLPNMERMFSNRPSTDLRRPLQGTETLLSALADGFTCGSPSTLLSALECLKLRKSHRQIINNILLKTRSQSLLYGLIVAGGRLVSVVRPRKHSLHPGDLHLIFNMLFEAGSVKAGGGENWIPLCLPGFNNTGYLYMYVSFLSINNTTEEITERPKLSSGSEDEVAILLISANKEGFFELRQMRDDLIEQLSKNRSLNIIRSAVRRGRPSCTDIVPGTVLRHFLYKSRGNVQFTMPSFDPYFTTPLARRRLLNIYTQLHTALHTRPTAPKIHHSTASHHISLFLLAWTTPLFELYCLAPSNTTRAALAQAANKLLQWVRREEERIFIIGGAVF